MNPENVNKNQKGPEESLIQNDELLIKPQGVSEKQVVNEPPAPAIEPAPEPPAPLTTQENEQKIITKQPIETFDLKLKELNKKSAQEKIKNAQKEQEKVIKEEVKPVESKMKEPKSLAFAILKVVFLLVLGFGLFALTIYVDNYVKAEEVAIYDNRFIVTIPGNETIQIDADGQKFNVKNEYEFKGGEILDTQSVRGISMNLPLKGMLRLDANTIIKINDFNVDEEQFELTLIQGKIWGNLLNNFFDLRINSGKIAAIPSLSLFNIEYDGTRTNIFAQKHDVTVEILANDRVINKLWIAEGNKAQFLDTKIDQEPETIEQLLYSKLVKEFNYGRAANITIDQDSWIVENIQKDNKLKTSIDEKFIKSIREMGLKNISTDSLRFQTKQFLSDLREALTFTDQKKASSLISDIFENINDAAFLYIQGNSTDAGVRLSLFKDDIKDPVIIQNEFANELLYKELANYLEDYLYLTPDNKLYPIKELLYEEIFNSKARKDLPIEEQYNLLTLKLNDVYDALEIGSNDADIILERYFELYETLTKNYRDNIIEIQDQIIRQNILVDNLLFLNSDLYKIGIFESKKKIEEDYLATISGSRDKKEQRQTFINEKINLLSRIQYFLFNEELDPADARQIVFRLLADMEELKQDTLDLTAINDLFEKRLADFGLFWEYLKSDEYSTTPLHGATHLERFEAFKEIQKQNITFEDIRKEIFGTSAQLNLTAGDVLARVKKDLNDEGIVNIEFGFYEDTTKTKVPILSAEVNKIVFRGTYDWDRELLSNIIIDDKIVTQEGIKLNKAKSFILGYIDTQSGSIVVPDEEEPIVKENEVAKTAKVFVVGKFSDLGVVLNEENVAIVDFNNGIYRVIDVYFNENRRVVFSFDYYSKDDKVTNVIVMTAAGERSVSGTFDLIFLDDIVFKVYDEETEK